jgi:hypothetical protein
MRQLQDRILASCNAQSDNVLDTVLAHWDALYNSTGIMRPDKEAAAKQREWDRPCVSADFCKVMSGLPDRRDQDRLLALRAPHSGDWLHVLSISSCGLRLDDKAVRMAVGLLLGAKPCEPHICPCGPCVDSRSIHSLACM